MTAKAKVIATLASLAMLTPLAACRVEHDNPPRPLNAEYHQLPQSVVDSLLKEVPQPPEGEDVWCLADRGSDGRYTSYCISYTAQACRDLASSDQCDAKIGAVRPDVGVCKERIEKVTIG
jgi:hypothetical protein